MIYLTETNYIGLVPAFTNDAATLLKVKDIFTQSEVSGSCWVLPNKNFYEVDFSVCGLENGHQYEYRLYSDDTLLVSGLLQMGDYTAEIDKYNTEIAITAYYER